MLLCFWCVRRWKVNDGNTLEVNESCYVPFHHSMYHKKPHLYHLPNWTNTETCTCLTIHSLLSNDKSSLIITSSRKLDFSHIIFCKRKLCLCIMLEHLLHTHTHKIVFYYPDFLLCLFNDTPCLYATTKQQPFKNLCNFSALSLMWCFDISFECKGAR